jgi:hypothetical protein
MGQDALLLGQGFNVVFRKGSNGTMVDLCPFVKRRNAVTENGVDEDCHFWSTEKSVLIERRYGFVS